ncbi:MAG: response regulator [Chloroflexota bacterium]|jgi:DNA-binding response OmpR family regulator|nr:response regulator [Anaerolineae bacterium]HMM28451.1 response regulator [Aggregatilineaceae bacterium]
MPARILIVDDDPLMCNLLTLTLHREGYETEAVYSGQDALDYLSGSGVDLILLDIMMADFNGFQVLRALRADPSTATIPVILLTARVDSISQKTGLDAGAVDYLTKPITPDVLVSRVRDVLSAGS